MTLFPFEKRRTRRREPRSSRRRRVILQVECLEDRTLLSNAIVAENMLPGTPSNVWNVDGIGDPSLQGYSTDISVNHGSTISFKIDDTANAPYQIDIYRLGYYGGDGARFITTISPSGSQDLVQNQPAPIVDAATGLIDCGNWAVSASWAVPATAVSGVYIARLVRNDTGGASLITFIIRADESHSDVLFQTSDATWEAYNTYGGNSLYGPSGNADQRAYAVSYNRPLNDRGTQGGLGDYNTFFYAEFPMVEWLEKNGYDVTYFTDVDSDRNGSLILDHKLFLSVGHDEYWTANQLANVQAARDAGVNLAFFSGNEATWETQLGPSADGSNTPNRTIICYKDSLNDMPINPNTNTWTGEWYDLRFSPPYNAVPENALTGQQWTVNRGINDQGTPLTLTAVFANLRFWRNTAVANLQSGQSLSLGTAVLGYEWDSDLDNGYRPAGLFDLSATTQSVSQEIYGYEDDDPNAVAAGVVTNSQTLYRAASGALVFGAGTVQWSFGLIAGTNDDGPSRTPDLNMEQATVNLFADMNVQPGSLDTASGLVAATASSDTTAPSSVITSPAGGAQVTSGTAVTITGTATDTHGGVIAAVEVSTDGGQTWHRAVSQDTAQTTWSYVWVPGALGSVTILSRAVNDSGYLETPSAGVTVTMLAPTGALSLWGPSDTPVNASAPDRASVEVGVKIQTAINGYITGLRFYKGSANTGTHVGHLWTANGTLLATATFTNETASGWQEVDFATPVAVTAGTTYVASYYAPNGGYALDYGYFMFTGRVNGPLSTLPDRAATGGDGVFMYSNGGGFPNQTYNASNYWVDVVFSASTQTTPSVVSEVPAANAGGVATATIITATFNESVQAGSISFVLKDANGNSVAGSVSYSDSNHTATFQPSAALAASTTYTATVSGATDANGNTMTSPFSWSFTTQGTGTSNTIWSSTTTPGTPTDSDASAVELGLKFQADVSGSVTAIRFYKGSSSNGGTHVGHLWTASGTLLATVTFTNETASGWQQVNLSSPVTLTAGTTYIVSYYAPQGHYAADNNYFASTGIDTGVLKALSNSAAGGNGVYIYGTGGGFPTQTYQSTNYWVDVVFSPSQGNTTPPTVTGESPANGTTGVATSTSVTATFSESVQPSTIVFTLKDASNNTIATTLSYNDTTHTATWQPNTALATGGNFTATVSGAKDLAGNVMTGSVTWSFSTAADTTPPTVSSKTPANGATAVPTNTSVSATFSESVQPATIVFTLKDASNNTVATTLSYNDTTHTATWQPNSALAASTTYTATVSGAKDQAGNVMTGTVTWSFTTAVAAPNSWQQTTVADFSAGTQSGTVVTNSAGGEVQLAPSFLDDFNGSSLSSSWTSKSWASQGGGPLSLTVSGGILALAGGEILSVQTVSGMPVEGRISFGAAAYQHFGLATDVGSVAGNSWAMFSTNGTTNTLYARVNSKGKTQDVSLGALPSGFHVYQVRPISTGYRFYVDNVLKTTISLTIPSSTALKLMLSAFKGSPQPAVQADWIRVLSYPASGTFTSTVFDAGRAATWGTASWTATLPANTTLVIQTRSGNTATPDSSWSSWTTVGNGGTVASPSSRYLQYQVLFTTTDSTATAVLSDVTFNWS